MTRARHVAILREVLGHVAAAQNAAALELAAEDLRLAQRALGRMTGAVDVEQLLDVVFADFVSANNAPRLFHVKQSPFICHRRPHEIACRHWRLCAITPA